MTEPMRQCPHCEEPTTSTFCERHGLPALAATIFEEEAGAIEPGHVLIGRFRIDRVLGGGTFGTVYAATQAGIERAVAIKVLRRDRTLGTRALKRFYREARAIGLLNHPNIVQIFDFAVDPDLRAPFIVFELVEGETLAKLIARSGQLTERRAAQISAQVAGALVEAHAENVIHRDLKPDNVMITRLRDGREHAKVLDFGIARVLGGEDGLTPLTAPGGALGTPHFMSPEQARGLEADFRSDLYSLGCMSFYALTGTMPFRGANISEIMEAHVIAPIPELPARLATGEPPSPEMRALIAALMAKSPEDRPATTDVVFRVFDELGAGRALDVDRSLERARAETLRLTPQRFGEDTLKGVLDAPTLDPERALDTMPPPVPQRGSLAGRARWSVAVVAVVVLLAIAVSLILRGGEVNRPGATTFVPAAVSPEASQRPSVVPRSEPATESPSDSPAERKSKLSPAPTTMPPPQKKKFTAW